MSIMSLEPPAPLSPRADAKLGGLGAGWEVRSFAVAEADADHAEPAAPSFMCSTTLPTPARFRPLGPPMFDSPRIAC
jgi:hypothetical protein